jgi:23S rRNA-/tRNA-specific pseudouridylate synthase
MRLDTWLIRQVRVLSRVHVKRLIHAGRVRIDGSAVVGSPPVHFGQMIEIDVPPPVPTALKAQDIPLDVIHEDRDIVVINKPPGLVHRLDQYAHRLRIRHPATNAYQEFTALLPADMRTLIDAGA